MHLTSSAQASQAERLRCPEANAFGGTRGSEPCNTRRHLRSDRLVEGIACGTAAAWLELNLPNEHDLGWAGGLSALVVPAGASALVLALLWLSASPTAPHSSAH